MSAAERAMLDMQEAWERELKKLRRERDEARLDAYHLQGVIEQRDGIIARQDARIERYKATIASMKAITVKPERVRV